jgi:hypothetical protein
MVADKQNLAESHPLLQPTVTTTTYRTSRNADNADRVTCSADKLRKKTQPTVAKLSREEDFKIVVLLDHVFCPPLFLDRSFLFSQVPTLV